MAFSSFPPRPLKRRNRAGDHVTAPGAEGENRPKPRTGADDVGKKGPVGNVVTWTQQDSVGRNGAAPARADYRKHPRGWSTPRGQYRETGRGENKREKNDVVADHHGSATDAAMSLKKGIRSDGIGLDCVRACRAPRVYSTGRRNQRGRIGWMDG